MNWLWTTQELATAMAGRPTGTQPEGVSMSRSPRLCVVRCASGRRIVTSNRRTPSTIRDTTVPFDSLLSWSTTAAGWTP